MGNFDSPSCILAGVALGWRDSERVPDPRIRVRSLNRQSKLQAVHEKFRPTDQSFTSALRSMSKLRSGDEPPDSPSSRFDIARSASHRSRRSLVLRLVREARESDAAQLSHLVVPGGEVVLRELGQVVVAAGSSHHRHQLDGSLKECGKAVC